MNKIIVKNGKLLSPKDGYNYDELDIFIKDGEIKEIDKNIKIDGADILELNGEIVSPGFIDIHTHCYKGKSPIGTEADDIGIFRGVTTIFDAGTSGPLNYSDFKCNVIDKSRTNIYTFLNVANWGLNSLNELVDLEEINEETVLSVVDNNKDNILGIKVRASSSVVGNNGIIPIIMAKNIAKKAGLPLIVHIGNYPPDVTEVISLLGENDIVTHTYHGKANGLFNKDGELKREVLDAKDRGVRFDVGHGSESFSFNTFDKALKINFKPDFISTDLYHKNMVEPVGSLLNVINKLIACGMSLEECIHKVTYFPAQFFKLKNKGQLKIGSCGDLTIFGEKECNEYFEDSYKNKKNVKQRLEMKYVIITGGTNSEVLKYIKK